MAISNRIARPAEQTKAAGLVEYQANGEIVKISPAMIKKYLVNGGGNVTDEEVIMFLNLCRFQHLNPFIREAYLIKYGNSPATMVIGKDVLLKRAYREPNFEGLEAGIIVEDKETGQYVERAGMLYQPEVEKLVGGWCKVHVKGFVVPFYVSVPLSEYIGRKSNGEVNGQWASKPATMIRKVAISQALREAFPGQNSGLYEQEEIKAAQDVILDETAVVVADTKEDAGTVPTMQTEPQEPKSDSVADALFG